MKSKAIERIENDIKQFSKCELYCHGYSRTPLTDKERQEVFDVYRQKNYTITPKINSHGVTYYSIS
jgi:hypothetical protein